MPDEISKRRHITLLQAVGVAQAAEEPLNVEALAAEFGVSEPEIRMDVGQLSSLGLILLGDGDDAVPRLMEAGRQYLARDGEVPYDEARFLAGTIDDLLGRRALMTAGQIVVDIFRDQILSGSGIDYAISEIVPQAFAGAVDERLMLDLYAAGVALMARLSADQPAGCVAEEIFATAVVEEAKVWLELRVEDGEVGRDEAEAAAAAIEDLFELFQDDDVLGMFDMAEPADAALAGHDPINQQLGVADQRVESWFEPFGWTAPTGYLADRSPVEPDVEDDGA